LIKDLLAKNHLTTLKRHPHIPDLFPREKPALNKRRFCDSTEIIKNATEELKDFHKTASRNVSNNFTVAVRDYFEASVTEMIILFCISQIKVIP
jgi:hypothetical protein